MSQHEGRELAAIICNECEAVIRTVSTREVEAIMMQMAETDVICSATCTHCGAPNTFLGMSAIEALILLGVR
jgi:Na+-translocating ferredoxin:NAD+ oxidoreductase RNF subunit RnfB